MKKLLNKKIYLFPSIIFIWQLLICPVKSLAETLKYVPLEPKAFSSTPITSSTSLGDFLAQAFSFGLAIAAALAVIMITWGGVKIMLTESVFEKDDGKEKIKNAIYGLLLALGSYLILYTINPDILKFTL